MDFSNSGFNENTMSPGVQSFEPLYCTSMETMCSSNAPESAGCCTGTSNNDTSNTHKTCNSHTSIDYAHIPSSSDDFLQACATTDNDSNTSKTGYSVSHIVSTNDTLHTPETCDFPAACATINTSSNASKDGDCLSSCVSPNTPASDVCICAHISENDISNTSKDKNCSSCVSVNDNKNANGTSSEPKTTEYLGVTIFDVELKYASRETEIGEILSGYIMANDTPNAEKINEDVCRVVTELAKLSFTKRELNGNELMQMNGELIQLKEKGLFTYDTIALIKIRLVKQFYYQVIDFEEYHLYLRILNNFSDVEKSANKVNDNTFWVKYSDKVNLLMEHNQISEKAWSDFKNIEKKKDEIQKRLTELQFIDIPGILESMKTIEEIGILSDILILKLKLIAVACNNLTRLVEEQNDRLCDSMRGIKKENDEEEKKIGVIICVRKKENKQPKRAEKQSKATICRSEHNTPFCGHCGWRTSWVKAFKKRGVFIKQDATGGNNKHIWVNCINES